MNHHSVSLWMRGRAMAAVACAALAVPMIGCGSGGGAGAPNASGANLPPIDDSRGGMTSTPPMQTRQSTPPKQGMSTKKKVVLLAGAAALYYLYRKHQANKAQGSTPTNGEPVYYLSKNGRVYYRDASKRPHYVTAPPQGIQVPYQEAQQYQGLQGYDGSQTGMTDLSRFAQQSGGY